MNRSLAGIALALAALTGLRADEGMWTFDNLPTAQMQAKYGFTPDGAWLDHLRLATVRFPGGTGSFISADGLVLTNHHVGHGWIERVSGADHDYIENGFVAADRAHEIRVPGLELSTLMGMEDVTAALAKAGAPAAQEAALAHLLQEARDRTGLNCQAVRLYQGGETWIYSYKIHKDVRLVMAPEYAIAAFGKDWDNFSFPRHDLDFSLFRVYEDGRPYTPPHHLAWAGAGPKYGDLTLVVGHPGHTSRLETLAQMEAYRDVLNPAVVRSLERSLKVLHAFAAQSPDHARQVSGLLMGLENGYKVYVNEIIGLQDREAMAGVAREEAQLRAAVARDPELAARAGDSWDQVAKATAARCAARKDELILAERGGDPLLGFARGLVRLQEQAALPAAQRRPEFRAEADLARQRERLRNLDAPSPELQQVYLELQMGEALEALGSTHPYPAALLAGRTPEAAARALVAGTRLREPERRAQLLDGGAKALAECQDPLVLLARQLETLAQPLRKQRQDREAVIADHGARIANARFKVRGRSVYPDATFTLRLSYGSVETYPANGTLTQPFTTFGGLFDRADAWGPDAEDHSWALPASWTAARSRLDPSTHFDFITSNDIIGGNSGSPVVDRQGRLVGLVFDGNIESNAGAYFFNPKVNRTVAVDGAAILAALDKVYHAPHLVQEITHK